jgi:hypothetical protein
MVPGATAQGLTTDRAGRRTLIGFLLGGFFQEFALQTLRLPQNLFFHVPERLITGANAPG